MRSGQNLLIYTFLNTYRRAHKWWWSNKRNPLWNSLHIFCHVSRTWQCWSLMPFPVATVWKCLNFFLSLECKLWFQVGLWAGCGEQPRGTTCCCRAALLPCEIMHQDFTNVWFSRPRADITAQLSLSPAVLQHFYPATFSLLVFEIYSVPILSLTLHIACFSVFIITVQCLPENGLQILNYME